ncbi:hypothetical protein AB4225_36225 [Streptomyces sp. 2RAF24]|uniref:hypothetical protein n=1 Tax=Streptomyces sp. 2RAF24 TaxID=3232997 RepID=UPI003F99CBCC
MGTPLLMGAQPDLNYVLVEGWAGGETTVATYGNGQFAAACGKEQTRGARYL